MNITITTFSSPFSFFCKVKDDDKDPVPQIQAKSDNPASRNCEISDVKHGQYVAVWWDDKWARGIISMESQFLIWLIDYGIYVRPNETTLYIDQPSEYKKLPTKVFEASIHGVTPVDKVITEDCQIKNEATRTWNKAAVDRAQSLIASAHNIYFVPISLMSTKDNDIVLGDLYLHQLSSRRIVNIVEELELWPVFLERNEKTYLENMALHYTTRRRHRACSLKPDFPNCDLPPMTPATTLAEYKAICETTPQLERKLDSSDSEDGSTLISNNGKKKDKTVYRLTAAEMEHYSQMYVTIRGEERNVLNILVNKIRDLNMCERYKDHDLKSAGRICRRTRKDQSD